MRQQQITTDAQVARCKSRYGSTSGQPMGTRKCALPYVGLACVLNKTRNRTHRRITEWLHNVLKPCPARFAVGIQEGNQVATRGGHSNIAARVGAKIAVIANDAKRCTPCVWHQSQDRLGCAIARIVIHNNDFCRNQCLPQQTLHAHNDLRASVAARYNDGNSHLCG